MAWFASPADWTLVFRGRPGAAAPAATTLGLGTPWCSGAGDTIAAVAAAPAAPDDRSPAPPARLPRSGPGRTLLPCAVAAARLAALPRPASAPKSGAGREFAADRVGGVHPATDRPGRHGFEAPRAYSPGVIRRTRD